MILYDHSENNITHKMFTASMKGSLKDSPKRILNVKCGACGLQGHTRKCDRCPKYWTQAEQDRRKVSSQGHMSQVYVRRKVKVICDKYKTEERSVVKVIV